MYWGLAAATVLFGFFLGATSRAPLLIASSILILFLMPMSTLVFGGPLVEAFGLALLLLATLQTSYLLGSLAATGRSRRDE